MEEKEFNELMAKIQNGLEKILKDSAIAAQPIPQFAKGTDSAPGGLVSCRKPWSLKRVLKKV
jgi:hypothetical protein